MVILTKRCLPRPRLLARGPSPCTPLAPSAAAASFKRPPQGLRLRQSGSSRETAQTEEEEEETDLALLASARRVKSVRQNNGPSVVKRQRRREHAGVNGRLVGKRPSTQVAQGMYQATQGKRLMSEKEWRGLGVQQDLDWEHYEIHRTEPHTLLFRKPFATRRRYDTFVVTSAKTTDEKANSEENETEEAENKTTDEKANSEENETQEAENKTTDKKSEEDKFDTEVEAKMETESAESRRTKRRRRRRPRRGLANSALCALSSRTCCREGGAALLILYGLSCGLSALLASAFLWDFYLVLMVGLNVLAESHAPVFSSATALQCKIYSMANCFEALTHLAPSRDLRAETGQSIGVRLANGLRFSAASGCSAARLSVVLAA